MGGRSAAVTLRQPYRTTVAMQAGHGRPPARGGRDPDRGGIIKAPCLTLKTDIDPRRVETFRVRLDDERERTMAGSDDKTLSLNALSLSRRALLRGAAFAGAGALFGSRALAQEDPIAQVLQIHSGEWSDGFDAASSGAATVRTTLPILSTETTMAVDAAIAQYNDIVARGGWPVVPADKTLQLGMRDPSVLALRERLTISGDLSQSIGMSDAFDSFVDGAVRRFQARHGIAADGVAGSSTLNAMNIPAAVRLGQLTTNLERLRSMTAQPLGDRYVCANIPAAQVEAVEYDRVVSRHTTVVGKVDRQSPVLSSKIYQINFNPYWTVPASIIKKDLIPLMQKQPDYLTKKHIRIFTQKGDEIPPEAVNWHSDEAVNYMFRQDPGDFNSLGTVKISFHNPYQVYMHDTPAKDLFGREERFDSSGCMRTQNIRQLITWLLRDSPGWDRTRIDEVFRTAERIDADIADPVPLYWVYITAWAMPDGAVHFRNDIYNHDGLDQLALR